MKTRSHVSARVLVLVAAGWTLSGCQDPAADAQQTPAMSTGSAHAAEAAVQHGSMEASVSAVDGAEAAGRYLVLVGGCNDCHTDGYLPSNGAVPESEWLRGSVLGFSGPWGTTYPSNLRLTVRRMTEDEWARMLGTRTGMPPMPWPSVAAMSEADRRALYRYIRSLGEPGEPAPANLPPGDAPTTPWIDFVPRNTPASSPPVAGAR